MSNGNDLIADERERQQTKEGWTQAHDDIHPVGQMAVAGYCYHRIGVSARTMFAKPADWPWGDEFWKPYSRLRNLVRAGALYQAEIDKLCRLRMAVAEEIDRLQAESAAPEPDISHAGEKHIKPCKGCDVPMLWAKHEKTLKPAPLVKTKAGETPNIIAYFDEGQDQWFYKIKGAKSEVRGTPEYVNHFMNCPRSKDFRAAPLTEDEERQATIK